MSQEALKMADFAYINSIMSYGIFLEEINLIVRTFFKIQKRAIRITTNSRPRLSCREMFKKIGNIALIFSLYFSLTIFLIKKQTFILY
jgi:phosphate starvation-inducible membrane PsiE